MVYKRILAVCTIMFLVAWSGMGQGNKWRWVDYDVSEKQIKGSVRHDYITEKGDTLKAIPIVRGYVECTIGRDSLKTRMKEIYFDNYYKYNEYEYLNLWIDAYLLFDGELTIKEVRMTVPRREKHEIEKFQLDICNDLAEFLKTTRWIKKEGFPEPSAYSLISIGFWNSTRYLYEDIQPY